MVQMARRLSKSRGHHGKLRFVTNETVLNSLSTFLIRSGVAFNAIDNEDFKTFYRLCRSDTKAPTLGRSVHNSNIDSYYDEFKGLFVQAVSNEIRTMHGIPFLPSIDGETRAAGIPTLIQKVVFNYSLLHEFFTEECPVTEQEVFTCITEEEWNLLIEIEAIVEPLAKFTRANVQSGSVVTASYFLYWKQQFVDHVKKKESFQVLSRIDRAIHETYVTQKRVTKSKTLFSDSSSKCFKRLRHQLQIRFDRPQRSMDLTERDELDLFFAMCLDPRTKSLGRKNVYALNLIALKAKHYEFYVLLSRVSGSKHKHSSESVDCNSDDDSSDNSGDVHGEYLDIDESMVVDSRKTDMVSRAESDKIVDDWMKLRIDFDAVAREQYSKKNKDFDQTELYIKVKVPGRNP